MKSMPIIVQKYGGSSVANAEKIKKVAKFISQCVNKNQRICVVVSAMGHTTNELIMLAHEVAKKPPLRELDMLISCGERESMALLAMALSDIGISAISLTGSQSGIITTNIHNGAEIVAIRPHRVLSAFAQYQVVIIAGFQGISETKEITTLKRGGSDTTAVGMAAALKAKVCEIYTDVPGVMAIDPRVIKKAQFLKAISFDQIESMTLYGARILAHDAALLAKGFGVCLKIADAFSDDGGTNIDTVDFLVKSPKEVLALTHLRALIKVKGLDWQENILNSGAYFLCGSMHVNEFVGYISNDISQELLPLGKDITKGLALVTVHLSKNQFAGKILSHINKLLFDKNILIEDLLIGRNEIFIILADENLNQALNILHENLLVEEC